MSENILKRKITFDNKEDSVIINSDSKFVLTAANINEIKEVVNNLSDEIDNRLHFNQIFKYSKFNVPSTLKEGCTYTFELELSENEDFTDSVKFSLENNFEKFSIFENNIWKNFTSKRYIYANDKNKSLKIDLSDVISDSFKPYFGRCRWKNETTLEIQDYQGFSLGIFEYNDKKFDDNYIKEFYIVGRTSLNEKESISYDAFYLTSTGEKINVTSSTTFSSITNICSFENNILNVPVLHTIKNEIIKAEFEFNSIKYIAFLNLILNPIFLENVKINGNIDTIYQNDQKHFTISAIYSDRSVKYITNKCEKILLMEECSLSGNNIIGEGCFDEYGSLVVSYVDEDFEEESITVVKYINFKTKKIKSLNVNFPTTIKGDEENLTYSATITYNDNSTKDVTNKINIKLIDCLELTCENGNIIINKSFLKSKKRVVGIVDYIDDCKNLSITTTISTFIDPILLVNINPKFYLNENEINSVLEKSTISYKVFGLYNDGSEKELDYEFIDVELNSTPNIVLNTENKTITIGAFEFSETIIVNFNYSNILTFEKQKMLSITPVKLQMLLLDFNETEINGLTSKFNAIENVPKTILVSALFSDGSIKGIDQNCEFNLAAGNPNLIKTINKNIITFDKPERNEEAISLIVSYQDQDFSTEKTSEFFTITVFSNNN